LTSRLLLQRSLVQICSRATPRRATPARTESTTTPRGAFDTELSRLGFKPRSELVRFGEVRPRTDVAAAFTLARDEYALIRQRHMYAGTRSAGRDLLHPVVDRRGHRLDIRPDRAFVVLCP
jgi:hypothetical protein